MLRGIQRCPVAAVHHRSWPRCSFHLNQRAIAIHVPFRFFRRPFLPMYFLQVTLFPCAAPLLYSKHNLAPNSSPLWWSGCPPSTVLQTLVSHTRQVHLWWLGPSHCYGALYCCLLEGTANAGMLH